MEETEKLFFARENISPTQSLRCCIQRKLAVKSHNLLPCPTLKVQCVLMVGANLSVVAIRFSEVSEEDFPDNI